MSSYALPLAVTAWVLLCVWAVCRLGQAAAARGGPAAWPTGPRRVLQAGVLAALLPLPVADELVAKPQFDALCRDHTAVQRHAAAGPGRHVHRIVLPPTPLTGLAVPVTRSSQLYVDDETRETLASVSVFSAHPGKLARMTGATAGPLTFAGRCDPVDPGPWLDRAGWRERAPLGEGAPSP